MSIFSIFKKKNIDARGGCTDGCFHNAVSLPFRGFSRTGALKLSTVYRCVDLISSSIAQLPIVPYHVFKGHKRIAYEQAAFSLLKNPNRRMTTFTLVKMLIGSMLLHGNGYAYIRRSEDGTPEEIVFLPPNLVTIIEPSSLFEDIRYNVVGLNSVVEHSDMIHLLNYTDDGYTGKSTLSYAVDALAISSYSEGHAKTYFKKGANATGYISVNSVLTEKQKKDIKESWRKSFDERDESFGIPVFEGGVMDYHSIQINPKDAQLLESRQFNVLDIARFFGVPATKLNSKEGATYNGIEAEQIAFLTDTIQPLIEKIEAEFERKLFFAKDRPFIDVKFDVANLLRVDIKSKSEYYAKMFQIGVYSPNEIRQELGYDAVPDGDDHFVQVNLMTLKQFNKTTTANPDTTNP